MRRSRASVVHRFPIMKFYIVGEFLMNSRSFQSHVFLYQCFFVTLVRKILLACFLSRNLHSCISGVCTRSLGFARSYRKSVTGVRVAELINWCYLLYVIRQIFAQLHLSKSQLHP